MAFKLKSLPLPYSLHSSTRQNPNFTLSNHRLPRRFSAPSLPLGISLSSTASASRFHRTALVTARAVRSDEIANEGEEDKDEELSRQGVKKELANQGIWSQMKDIVMFTGPATGLWICAPLMSLIDTAVIGQRSSIELAALGPATVVCDYMSYVFMFLSIATSNMVATALAKQVGNRHVRLLDGKLVNMMHIRSRSVTLTASMLLCVVSEVKLHFVLQGRMVRCGFSSQILEHGLPYILLPYEDNIEL